MEILTFKTKITNLIDGLNSRMEGTEEISVSLKDRTTEITQHEQRKQTGEKKKKRKKSKKRTELQDLWDYNRRSNINAI